MTRLSRAHIPTLRLLPVPTAVALVVSALVAPAFGATDRMPADSAAPVATASAPPPPASDGTSLAPRSGATKPDRTELGAHDSREYVQVKFTEGTGVRLRSGKLAAPSTDLSAVRSLLTGTRTVRVSRLFRAPEKELAALGAKAAARSGRAQADLNLWYRLRLAPGSDPAQLIDRLNSLPQVEIAHAEPEAAPPPLAPDFSARQGYRKATGSGGIDTEYAATVAGGKGKNVRILDIEYGWNTGHEDLAKLRAPGASVPNGTPSYSYSEHGTAVMGQLGGDDNGGGVTGLAPDASLHYTNVTSREAGYDPAGAVLAATRALSPGDVMLLEQQVYGPSGCGNFVPVEWIASVHDAISTATATGIHVVEAAGNGAMNLDNSCFGPSFPRGMGDSGAVIVGAGGAPDCSGSRTRLGYSTYGSRVNLQGWGECVTSTGYGDLYGSDVNTRYTAEFSGTSSASPIVTGAVAVLSSIAEERGLPLTPVALRQHLRSTGAPQTDPSRGNIGPLPDLRAAITGLSGEQPTGCAALRSVRTGTLPVGATVYQPDGRYWYSSAAGPHRGCLDGPDGTDLDLSLQRWNGSNWVTVASATGPAPDENLNHQGSAGYYRYRITAPAGGGAWTLGYDAP